MPPPDLHFFPIPEGEIAYLKRTCARPDAPTLVFCHATGLNAPTYAPLFDILSERFTVLAPDARGHGHSRLPANPSHIRNWRPYLADLLAFLQSLDKPVHLAGHSMGGILSLATAHFHPERVESLILIDPVMFPPNFQKVWRLMGMAGISHWAPPARRARKRRKVWSSLDAMRLAYRHRGMFKTWPEESLSHYLLGGTREREDGQIELTCDPAWEAATFASLPHSVWTWFRKLRRPATILHGSRSDTFTPESARTASRLRPDARLVAVPETGHFLPMEKPEEVAKVLIETIR